MNPPHTTGTSVWLETSDNESSSATAPRTLLHDKSIELVRPLSNNDLESETLTQHAMLHAHTSEAEPRAGAGVNLWFRTWLHQRGLPLWGILQTRTLEVFLKIEGQKQKEKKNPLWIPERIAFEFFAAEGINSWQAKRKIRKKASHQMSQYKSAIKGRCSKILLSVKKSMLLTNWPAR